MTRMELSQYRSSGCAWAAVARDRTSAAPQDARRRTGMTSRRARPAPGRVAREVAALRGLAAHCHAGRDRVSRSGDRGLVTLRAQCPADELVEDAHPDIRVPFIAGASRCDLVEVEADDRPPA